MTNSKKNPLKEQREWNDLLHEKKAYLKRKAEEKEANKAIKALTKALEDDETNDYWGDD